MEIEIIKVPTNHPDLLYLVDELNSFFIEEWGEEVNDSYLGQHQLTNMKAAFIAYSEKKPVGCICWKERVDGLVEIKRMYVKPECRGTDAAKSLLLTAEKDMVQVGHTEAVLETGTDMKQAIRFYEKQGYQIIPNFGEFVNDSLCVCLAKTLTK